MIVLMLATAVGIEVAFALAQKMNGFSVETLQKYGSPQFFAVSVSLTRVPVPDIPFPSPSSPSSASCLWFSIASQSPMKSTDFSPTFLPHTATPLPSKPFLFHMSTKTQYLQHLTASGTAIEWSS